MTAVESFKQMGQQSVFAFFKVKVLFRHKAVVDKGIRHGSRSGDETGIPAHDLDQPHAVVGA